MILGSPELNPKGKHPEGVITHIQPIAPSAKDRLGYPTQKPEPLLPGKPNQFWKPRPAAEGDVVLDPFCGCGTAIAVAEGLGRRWIGIDITHLAISLLKSRLQSTFGEQVVRLRRGWRAAGHRSARALATESGHDGRFQFEYWALGLVDARPGNNQRQGRGRWRRRLHQLLRRQFRQGKDGGGAGEERAGAEKHRRDAQGRHGAGEGGDGAAGDAGAADPPDGAGSCRRRFLRAGTLPGPAVPACADRDHRGPC